MADSHYHSHANDHSHVPEITDKNYQHRVLTAVVFLLAVLLLVKNTWEVCKDSAHILLEGSPESVEPILLRKELHQSIPEIGNIDQVHIWPFTGNRLYLTMHMEIDERVDHHSTQDRIHKLLEEKFSIAPALVQLESEHCVGTNC